MKPHNSSSTSRLEDTLTRHRNGGAIANLKRKDIDWAGLPKHLLGSVLEKLVSPGDYLRFESVCVSWHSMIYARSLQKLHHDEVKLESTLKRHGDGGAIANLELKDWAGLPEHLLDMILEKLVSPVDYLQFDCVCESWHWTKKDNHARRLRKLRHDEVPMLLIPTQEKYLWSLYDVTLNKYTDSKFMVPYDRRLSGSSQGWLLTVNEDRTVTLYNPFSKSRESNFIRLPRLFQYSTTEESYRYDIELEYDANDFSDDIKDYEYHVEQTLITADPHINPKECIVMIIFGEYCELAFFRVGRDTKWNKVNVSYYLGRRFLAVDMLHCDNQFYIVDDDGALVSFEVTDSGHSGVKLIAPEIEGLENPYDVQRYLVKSHRGDVTQVERYVDWGEEDCTRVTVGCRVFRLDSDKKNWIEIKSLGNTSLFLGDNSSISVLASNFLGILPNCLYFTHDFDEDVFDEEVKPVVCDYGVYHMDNGKYNKHFNIDPSTLLSTGSRRPIWITPILSEI